MTKMGYMYVSYCHHFASVICYLSLTFHILILSSETTGVIWNQTLKEWYRENVEGSLKLYLILFWSIQYRGTQRQLKFLIGKILKNLLRNYFQPNFGGMMYGRSSADIFNLFQLNKQQNFLRLTF